MRSDRSLTLIVSNLDRDLAMARDAGAARWPLLARAAGRGRVARYDDEANPIVAALAALAPTDGEFAEAAVMAAGAGYDAQHYWLRGTPMHLAAGLNDLRAVQLDGDQRMTDAEAAQLEVTLNTVLADEEATLRRDGHGGWLLQFKRALHATTSSPYAAATRLDAAMPRGHDAALLKRLMTEMQMVLHEHPVNVARARRGQPEINAVWLYGGGSAKPVSPRSLPAAFGVDPLLRGLYRLQGAASPSEVLDATHLLRQVRGSAVAAVDVKTLDELESQWLAPLIAALRSGALSALDLILGRWLIDLRRADLLKFWRPSRAPAQWPS